MGPMAKAWRGNDKKARRCQALHLRTADSRFLPRTKPLLQQPRHGNPSPNLGTPSPGLVPWGPQAPGWKPKLLLPKKSFIQTWGQRNKWEIVTEALGGNYQQIGNHASTPSETIKSIEHIQKTLEIISRSPTDRFFWFVLICVEAICFHLLAKLFFAAQFVLQSWFLGEVAYWFISAVFMVDALLLACGVGLYFLVEHAFLPFHLFHANSLELVLEIFWDGYGVFLALWWSDYGRPRNGGQHLKSPLHLRESLTFGSVCHLAILWMVVADWRMPLVIFRCHYRVSVLPRHLVAKTEFLARTTVLVLVANPGPIYSRMPLRWILHIHVAQLTSRALARAFSASK